MSFPSHRRDDFPDLDAFVDRIVADYCEALDAGNAPAPGDVIALYPEAEAELRAFFEDQDGVARALGAARAAAAAEASPIPAGDFGDYELLEEIARGGMGVVYRARHRKLGRVVALKTVLAGSYAAREARDRLAREAKAAARLDHPRIVPIYEVGEVAGVQYFTMKLIEGSDLGARGAIYGERPRRAARLVETAARAVHHAHERGIIHRDLKPANIIIDAAGEPWVTDFGLVAAAEGEPSLTATGSILGTPAYMAPEMAAGKGAKAAPAADIYSLGAILYDLLAGRPPFPGGSSLEVLRAIQERPPESPRAANALVPRDLETICLKCLEKQPARRYASALELADDLAAFLDGRPIRARPVSAAARAWRWCRRNRAAALAGALLAVLALGSATAAWTWHRERDAARRAEGESEERLWESRLLQARLGRLSGQAGQQRESLEALRLAAALRPAVELRDEAAACLALVDLRADRILEPGFRVEEHAAAVAADLERRAVATPEGIEIRDGDAAPLRLETAESSRSPPAILDLRFGPGGRHLGAARRSGGRMTFRLWRLDPEPGLLLRDAPLAGRKAWDFHPALPLVAIGRRDGAVAAFDAAADAAAAEPRVAFRAAGLEEISSLRFAPGGGRIAVAGMSPSGRRLQVRVWPAGDIIREFEPAGEVLESAWRPDARKLAFGGGKAIEVWDLETGARSALLAGHRSEVTSIDYSIDGDLLASTSWDGELRLWDPHAQRELLRARAGNYRAVFGSGGGRLAVLSNLGDIAIWEVARSRCFRSLRDERDRDNALIDLDFSPSGRILAVAGHGGVALWDLERGERAGFLPESREVLGVAFDAARGRLLGLVAGSGFVSWDLAPAEGAADGGERIDIASRRELGGEAGPAARPPAFALAAGKVALVGDYTRGRAGIFDLDDPARGAPLRGFAGYFSIALSPDGLWAAAGSRYVPVEAARVWDARTGEVAADLPAGGPARVVFDAGGRRLLAGAPREFRAWEAGSWNLLWTVPRRAPTTLPGPGAFSPDGRLAAVAATVAEVELVRAGDGEKVIALAAPDAQIVKALRFDPASRRLAALCENSTIQVWDLTALRRELAALELDWQDPARD